MSATKSLSREQNARVVAALKGLLKARYGDDQTALADAIGIKQGTLSDILAEKKGAGGKVLSGLARVSPADAIAVAGGRATSSAADTLAMARTAAENLVRAELASPDEAWLLMREISLNAPSVDSFYVEAKRRLRAPGAETGEVENRAAMAALERQPGPGSTSGRTSSADVFAAQEASEARLGKAIRRQKR